MMGHDMRRQSQVELLRSGLRKVISLKAVHKSLELPLFFWFFLGGIKC